MEAKTTDVSNECKFSASIPSGLMIIDDDQNKWRVGKIIGEGGCGEVYLVSDIKMNPVPNDTNIVAKFELGKYGTVYEEKLYYWDLAKPECIENWKKINKLETLSMPKYISSGVLTYKDQIYRFILMERYGKDLQKVLKKYNYKLPLENAYQIVIKILEVLEYIHHHGYVHCDIKASNILFGYQTGLKKQVFLVDYGIANHYLIDKEHIEYKQTLNAHKGTHMFAARDSHLGAHSRRGDIEILGYNLVYWLGGSLPWEDELENYCIVAEKKKEMMKDIPRFMKMCFPNGVPPGVQEFMKSAASLSFTSKPHYEKLKRIMWQSIHKIEKKNDGNLESRNRIFKYVKSFILTFNGTFARLIVNHLLEIHLCIKN